MKTDKKTLELIQLVKKQKEEIASLERPSYRTNCSFTFVEGVNTNAVNLHVETDVRKLVDMAGFLKAREKAYLEMASWLGVEGTPPTFTWSGYKVEEWFEDIKTRIAKVQISSKRKKLEALEERLNKIVSPELRAQLELEAIAGELGS